MSIQFRILGRPGRDNAVLMVVDSGQAVERLLFDCGEGCIARLPLAEIQAVEHLFFSHLHMDHIGGFDSFFRCNYSRGDMPNRIWGPPQTSKILQHRFQGFLWNLHEGMSASWEVADVFPHEICAVNFELREAFAEAHRRRTWAYERTICEGAGYTVEAVTMDHRTPSLAYIVREKTRWNVDTVKMSAMGLRPGPWVKLLKDPAVEQEQVTIDGAVYSLPELRSTLLVETLGDSAAYLTDFLLDEAGEGRIAQALQGCGSIICEAQYAHADIELAWKNYHMTALQAARLAKRAQARELILFHLSDRYQREGWLEMLREARSVFPNAHFPPEWNLEPLQG